MFDKVGDAEFVRGEHNVLKFWTEQSIFDRLRAQNANNPPWSFLDGPITANNPMGVHHAWGRTYKDAFQRYWAMNGRSLRYQNGFDCQGLWVEVEVEKQLGLGAKSEIEKYGIDRFVWECKKRVLKYAAVQTEQSVRLGYWMDWDSPQQLRQLADAIGTEQKLTFTTPRGETVADTAEHIVERLGNPDWGGSYFTFSTENNETIWTFLKKCFERGKIYRGHDVMPWSGKAGSAYSQMEVADGRKLTVHRALFVRLRILSKGVASPVTEAEGLQPLGFPLPSNEYLLIWTTTPWTLTSNVAAMVNPDLEYVQLQTKRDGAIYYFAKDNLEFQRLSKEFKEGFGRPEWAWPKDCPKLKTLAQIFKEQGGYEIVGTVKGAELIGWRYAGPFDDLPAQSAPGGFPAPASADDRTAAVDHVINSYKDDWQRYLDKHCSQRPAFERVIVDFCRSATYLQWIRSNPFEGVVVATLKSVEHWVRGLLLTSELALLAFEIEAAHSALLESSHPMNQDDESQEDVSAKVRAKLLSWPSIASGQAINSVDFIVDLQSREIRFLGLLRDELRIGARRSSIDTHGVIDGGRDFRGNANVTSGEGTGIVHSAPGCGDIDHVIGGAHQKPDIAPLGEDGKFLDGFGPFTSKNAVAPETVDLVIEELRKKDLLVAVEKYPHIYPFCWRTGDELVFRLVDEWFINMDWRDEIMDVTRQIQWLPDSIQGQEREVEWLSNMRDWMISKKRYWGLALPIWVNPNDPSDFEVIGSLEELQQRAVEGWNDFAGHTPHKPWIDGVKIKSEKTGAVLSRIPDVGNPWLDAGIVPFSTLGFNTHPDYWKRWYPADLVTECFPGQFRNWFYSMLSMSTMMRHGATDDPAQKRPFKTLLGHRLVMNEAGKPMHKSDGTAIWFEEAAEQLGVDTLRWLYLQQNPAQDLRFGTRHPDQRVTLETANGPTDTTIDGLPTCLVTSTPADDVRRQVLLPLWNSYAFFVNYARLDGFDPSLPAVPVS
jgi:isoleucyl-tRNA synthetase